MKLSPPPIATILWMVLIAVVIQAVVFKNTKVRTTLGGKV